MGKVINPMEQHVQQAQQHIQNPGMVLQLWNWIVLGLGGVITYLATQLRGKASKDQVDDLAEDLDKKVGKDQFKEFKDGNTALHKANGAKLDTIISHFIQHPPE